MKYQYVVLSGVVVALTNCPFFSSLSTKGEDTILMEGGDFLRRGMPIAAVCVCVCVCVCCWPTPCSWVLLCITARRSAARSITEHPQLDPQAAEGSIPRARTPYVSIDIDSSVTAVRSP